MPPLTIVDFLRQGALGTAEWLLSAGQSLDQVASGLQQQYAGLSRGDAVTITQISLQSRESAELFAGVPGVGDLASLNPPINPAGTPGFDTIEVTTEWFDPSDNTEHRQHGTVNVPKGGTIDDAAEKIAEWLTKWEDEYHLESKGVTLSALVQGITLGPAA